MTKIHWHYWVINGDGFIDFSEQKHLVDASQKNPNATLKWATDSEGDRFIVLASGDISHDALAQALDKEFQS